MGRILATQCAPNKSAACLLDRLRSGQVVNRRCRYGWTQSWVSAAHSCPHRFTTATSVRALPRFLSCLSRLSCAAKSFSVHVGYLTERRVRPITPILVNQSVRILFATASQSASLPSYQGKESFSPSWLLPFHLSSVLLVLYLPPIPRRLSLALGLTAAGTKRTLARI